MNAGIIEKNGKDYEFSDLLFKMFFKLRILA